MTRTPFEKGERLKEMYDMMIYKLLGFNRKHEGGTSRMQVEHKHQLAFVYNKS